MAENHVQVKISKEDMERLHGSGKKHSNNNKADKPKLKTSTLVLRIVLLVIAVAYVGLLLLGKMFLPAEIAASINPFAGTAPNSVVRAASLCVLVICVSFILRFIIDKVAAKRAAEKKSGIALIELFGNLIKYASYIVLLFLILGALGVDTAELLAGLGILTLILGLGVTSLIEDIVAGIFIIAERLFDVGDIIVVDGFRGTVVSIGIRSTKIADIGNDVLTVRNSSIGSLVNLTDRQSAAAITIPLAPQESIERVEAICKNMDWSYMHEKYPRLIGDPLYLGICEITKKGVQNLLIVGGCKEEDKYEIERALFLEFKLLFEKHGIQLGTTDMDDEEGE
jgi:small conductance mechanosensitive channel